MPTALLLVDHGSRRPEAHESLMSMAALLQNMRPDLIIRAAHMELAAPDIAEGVADCIRAGAREIVVFPFMLAPGRHAAEDIPRLAAEAIAAHPGTTLRVADPLGVHAKLAEIVLERTGLA